jgi:hypothetical protein
LIAYQLSFALHTHFDQPPAQTVSSRINPPVMAAFAALHSVI